MPAPTVDAIEALLRILDAQDVTLTQARLLLYLQQHDGSTNAAAADYMGLTRPSISALLDRLERRGLIRPVVH